MRSFLASFVATLLLAFPLSGHAAPMLQPSVTVTGSVIHLGDLFSDAGANAGDAVAPAPAPGMRITYSAAWLDAIAREHHLEWAPASDFAQATVERASRAVGSDVIAQHLLEALALAAGTDAEIRLDNPATRFIVPAEAADDIGVEGLNFDPRSGRFSAVIAAPAGAADAQRQRISGRLVVEVEVAAPNRAIAMNEIIGREDVEKIKLPRERIPADTITDAVQLIGKSARHLLKADQPLRAGDVEEPLVVHKGDLVTIEIRTPSMELTAQGKALDDAAMGATVRVTNTQSSRTVETTAAGPGVVHAGAPDSLAAR